MLIYKDGTKIGGQSTQIQIGTMVAYTVYENFGLDCVVTSACDFKHTARYSEHYQGNANDLRTKHIPTSGMKKTIFNMIKDNLPLGFILLFEGEGKDWEHFHLAWRPKYKER